MKRIYIRYFQNNRFINMLVFTLRMLESRAPYSALVAPSYNNSYGNLPACTYVTKLNIAFPGSFVTYTRINIERNY